MERKLYRYDPVVGWSKIPDTNFRLHFADGVFMYRTNSCGFRGNGEFQLRKPEGTKRVLFFGDSFTEGGCIDDGKRYTDLIGDDLGVEVYNFGLSGTGTDQQYLVYRDIASQYEHDLVVIGVWIENIRRNIARSRIHSDLDGRHYLTPKPYFTLGDGDELELHHQPVPRPTPIDEVEPEDLNGVDYGTRDRQGLRGVAAQLVTELGPTPKRLVQRAVRSQPYPEYDDPSGTPWRLTRRILEHWSSESRTPVVIVPIPIYQYIERTASSDAMRSRFAELHSPPAVHVHDPLPDFWEYPRSARQGFRFRRDHHFTTSGHAALSKSLQPLLTQLLCI